eukprot:TRINITY_DN8926_c1_g1_i2.p1 TRINITY_DN8926_c1_g1~~TRINITY_DN8926_c1_g1_i2.p1  ORF type:complete len:727 (+),score=214.22 TRINITY_DN8926_c1_g1_i2:80-2182(+)
MPPSEQQAATSPPRPRSAARWQQLPDNAAKLLPLRQGRPTALGEVCCDVLRAVCAALLPQERSPGNPHLCQGAHPDPLTWEPNYGTDYLYVTGDIELAHPPGSFRSPAHLCLAEGAGELERRSCGLSTEGGWWELELLRCRGDPCGVAHLYPSPRPAAASDGSAAGRAAAAAIAAAREAAERAEAERAAALEAAERPETAEPEERTARSGSEAASTAPQPTPITYASLGPATPAPAVPGGSPDREPRGAPQAAQLAPLPPLPPLPPPPPALSRRGPPAAPAAPPAAPQHAPPSAPSRSLSPLRPGLAAEALPDDCLVAAAAAGLLARWRAGSRSGGPPPPSEPPPAARAVSPETSAGSDAAQQLPAPATAAGALAARGAAERAQVELAKALAELAGERRRADAQIRDARAAAETMRALGEQVSAAGADLPEDLARKTNSAQVQAGELREQAHRAKSLAAEQQMKWEVAEADAAAAEHELRVLLERREEADLIGAVAGSTPHPGDEQVGTEAVAELNRQLDAERARAVRAAESRSAAERAVPELRAERDALARECEQLRLAADGEARAARALQRPAPETRPAPAEARPEGSTNGAQRCGAHRQRGVDAREGAAEAARLRAQLSQLLGEAEDLRVQIAEAEAQAREAGVALPQPGAPPRLRAVSPAAARSATQPRKIAADPHVAALRGCTPTRARGRAGRII